ncbi:N-acetylmuramoyl-L-alanine amidase [Streptomyces sp. NPDC058674]|uniref:N-acetylmuramoyl-L-alanine amidase n=1 Tax=Streptomyces sp. NPDC058674 TaxID=3346592 RepID=UPI00364F7F9E
MADPLSADRFLAALLAEGVRVQEHPGWRTHTRTAPGRPWGPVHGILVHHTVTSGSARSVEICRTGYSGLPGPLCQGVITKDGVFHLIGYGRCNHAGGGDPDVLTAVQDETYEDRPPTPNVGNSDGIDGNRAFYGWECENLGDGQDPWPAPQLDTIERASAAVCRAHGWSAKSVIGHKEWSDDKTDPRGFTMQSMRQRVATRLASKPGSGTPITPTPQPEKEDDMALTQERADQWNGMLWGLKNTGEATLARVTAIETLVKLIASDNDLDEASVAVAVEKAVAKALRENTVAVDVTVQNTTTPTPGA